MKFNEISIKTQEIQRNNKKFKDFFANSLEMLHNYLGDFVVIVEERAAKPIREFHAFEAFGEILLDFAGKRHILQQNHQKTQRLLLFEVRTERKSRFPFVFRLRRVRGQEISRQIQRFLVENARFRVTFQGFQRISKEISLT